MEWTQVALYIAVGLFALTLLCWLANLILVLRKKPSSIVLSRLMYFFAIAAVALNAVRSGFYYSEKTMLAANIVVLICVVISLVRLERVHKYGEPAQEEEESQEEQQG